MINLLVDAISLKLYDTFGDNYKIYTEEVQQGLKTPCFFINTLLNQEDLFRNNKYIQTNPFVIQYIPNTNNKKSECRDVTKRLYDSLEYITIREIINGEVKESLVRGSKMSSEYSDGVLNFLVSYDMYVYKEEVKAESMETCDYDNSVKG